MDCPFKEKLISIFLECLHDPLHTGHLRIYSQIINNVNLRRKLETNFSVVWDLKKCHAKRNFD